jgi:hypothetical protein
MLNPMLQSFLSTALPIVVAVLFGVWANNKRLDDLGKRVDDFARRLDRIENILDDIRKELASHNERITRLDLARR